MKEDELKIEFISRLIHGCEEHMNLMVNSLANKKLGAYVFHAYDGFHGIGIALCEESALLSIKTGIDLNSWSSINEHNHSFSSVNSFIDELYEIFYEEEIEGVDLDNLDDGGLWFYISDFFEDCIIQTYAKLQMTGFFKSHLFKDNMLLGVLMPDPCKDNVPSILRLSEALNSPYWHQVVTLNVNDVYK